MIWRIIGGFLFVVAFNAVALILLLQIPPVYGMLWIGVLGNAFIWWYLRDNRKAARRRAMVRLRRPRGSLTWILAAVGATLLLTFGMSGLIEVFTPPISPEDLANWEPLLEYTRSTGGWIAFAAFAGLLIPVVEEFVFRGHIQHSLEHRYGPILAIGIAAVVFMCGHIGVPHWSILLISLTIGLANGAAVYLFESIWMGVMSHGIWNLAISILSGVQDDPAATTVEAGEWTLFTFSAILLAAGAAGWWTILREGRAGIRGR